MLTKRKATPEDFSDILAIWERSVTATHHFLSPEDQLYYKEIIPQALSSVDVTLWYDGENLIGFTGVTEKELEMFFLDPIFIRKGYGSQIMTDLIEQKDIRLIDVNKQNEAATAFYNKHGFKTISESETDGFGKPYPILHLKR